MYRKKIAVTGAAAALLFVLATLVPAPQPSRAATEGNWGRSSGDAGCRAAPPIQFLAEVDNTRDSNFHCLGLELDGGVIRAVRVETHQFAPAFRQPPFEQVTVTEYSVATIESNRGAVLEGEPGHDAIILQGHFFNAVGHADLVTRYLYNGFTSEYRSCELRLDKSADSQWHLVNMDDQLVSHIVVRTRQVLVIGTIGIADLEGACAHRPS